MQNSGIQLNPSILLQQSLISKFTTGDPFWDPIINIFIYTIISTFVYNMKDLFQFAWLKYYLDKVVSYIRYQLNRLRKQNEKLSKSIVINYITENKKVCGLYKAVDWYISTQCEVDYITETPLYVSYENDLDYVELDNISLNRRITHNKYKELEYNNHKILYILNKELISVYADKERKRENYSITLSTEISKDATEDILYNFCEFCAKEYVKSKQNIVWAQKIYVNNEQGKWIDQISNNKRKLETVVLQNGDQDDIKGDIDQFIESEDWYHDRGIPYTRGYLFYGSPGSGKSSMIKAISNYTKRHMHYLMLNNITSDNQLLEVLKNIDYKKTILVIEDIDCMTDKIKSRDKKDNKKEHTININEIGNINEIEMQKLINGHSDKNNLTLSGLLNAIDGIFNNDGRILIMTTNKPEELDEALIRPGRIDRKIEFKYCTKKQISNIYNMMFDLECPKEILSTINDYEYSPADIISLCLRYRNTPECMFNNLDKIERNIDNIQNDKDYFEYIIENASKQHTSNMHRV